MIPTLLVSITQIDLPAPPIPGGALVTEWWRVIGLIAVTVLTTGVLALIFRPALAVPAQDVTTPPDQANLHPVPTNLAPLRRSEESARSPVVPFPDRIPTTPDPAALAAAERLRQLAEQSADPNAKPIVERRGLGRDRIGRRVSMSGEPNVTGSDAGPGGKTAPEGDARTTGDAMKSGIDQEQIAELVNGNASGLENEESMIGTADSWDLLGDLVDRLPSQADLEMTSNENQIQGHEIESAAHLADGTASESDELISESAPGPSIMSGDVPSAAEVERLAQQPNQGKIVQFVPRSAQPAPDDIDPAYELLNEISQPVSGDSVLMQFPVDLVTREAITATVQELLFCANVGEFIHGFALYTDKYLFKFMDQSGLNEDEFRERFTTVPPKDPEDWTRIDAIREFRRLDDGRVAAIVLYNNAGVVEGSERYVFKLDSQTNRWLIDDISPAL